jgi:hypothetical protein
MAPVPDRGADREAGFEDDRLQAARQEVCRGREPYRPGADHRDRQAGKGSPHDGCGVRVRRFKPFGPVQEFIAGFSPAGFSSMHR